MERLGRTRAARAAVVAAVASFVITTTVGCSDAPESPQIRTSQWSRSGAPKAMNLEGTILQGDITRGLWSGIALLSIEWDDAGAEMVVRGSRAEGEPETYRVPVPDGQILTATISEVDDLPTVVALVAVDNRTDAWVWRPGTDEPPVRTRLAVPEDGQLPLAAWAAEADTFAPDDGSGADGNDGEGTALPLVQVVWGAPEGDHSTVVFCEVVSGKRPCRDVSTMRQAPVDGDLIALDRNRLTYLEASGSELRLRRATDRGDTIVDRVDLGPIGTTPELGSTDIATIGAVETITMKEPTRHLAALEVTTASGSHELVMGEVIAGKHLTWIPRGSMALANDQVVAWMGFRGALGAGDELATALVVQYHGDPKVHHYRVAPPYVLRDGIPSAESPSTLLSLEELKTYGAGSCRSDGSFLGGDTVFFMTLEQCDGAFALRFIGEPDEETGAVTGPLTEVIQDAPSTEALAPGWGPYRNDDGDLVVDAASGAYTYAEGMSQGKIAQEAWRSHTPGGVEFDEASNGSNRVTLTVGDGVVRHALIDRAENANDHFWGAGDWVARLPRDGREGAGWVAFMPEEHEAAALVPLDVSGLPRAMCGSGDSVSVIEERDGDGVVHVIGSTPGSTATKSQTFTWEQLAPIVACLDVGGGIWLVDGVGAVWSLSPRTGRVRFVGDTGLDPSCQTVRSVRGAVPAAVAVVDRCQAEGRYLVGSFGDDGAIEGLRTIGRQVTPEPDASIWWVGCDAVVVERTRVIAAESAAGRDCE